MDNVFPSRVSDLKSNPIPLQGKSNPFIEDLFFEFFSFISSDVKFILNCRLVCKQWNNLIMNPNLWNHVEVNVSNLQKLPSQFKLVLQRIVCNQYITDNKLEHISQFLKLKQLKLNLCSLITDNGLQHLSKLTTLQQLELRWCPKITDNGLQHLTKLSLQQLDLSGCKI